jgi:hypothetical protein
MRIRPTIFATTLAAGLLIGSAAGAVTVEISTSSGETIGTPPVPYTNGDIVRYDTVSQAAAVVFDESLFGAPQQIDAWDVLPSGNVLLSTLAGASLGGTNFENGDIVEWNGSTLSILLDESLFGPPPGWDIDAVSMHPSNGNLLFSTASDATIGTLSFLDGDIVMWDGVNASIFFFETTFGAGDINVDAYDLAGDELSFLLSTVVSVTLLNSLGVPEVFLNGDLILYDIGTGRASRVFPESVFGGGAADVDAAAFAFDPVPVPEPGTASMLGLGLAGLAVVGRKRSAWRAQAE